MPGTVKSKLPYQFGKSYQITPNVVARTRTVFSRRMQGERQRFLADIIKTARDSLVYTIARIEANVPGINERNPPEFTDGHCFNDVFLQIFSVDIQTAEEYKLLLLIFKMTCVRMLHGLFHPLQVVDISIEYQYRNNHTPSYLGGFVRTSCNPFPSRKGPIHFNFGILHEPYRDFSLWVFLHEASHKFADTKDFVYIDPNCPWQPNLKQDPLLYNADSVSLMILRAYQLRLR